MQDSADTFTVVIASDHGGYTLKAHLIGLLRTWGYPVEDLGTAGPDAVDYPDFAAELARRVLAVGGEHKGVLICGTGIGMSITANRFPGIRAALCTSAYMARMARAHNDANVLCIGARVVGFGEAEDILKTFLEGRFEQGRHTGRVMKIERVAPSKG